MTYVTLVAMEIEKFQSFRQRQCIAFSQQPGLKFVTGRNCTEPRLGSNGAGKSSLFEAVTWCLFGTTSNGGRAADVVTWQEKRPEVRVRIAIDGAELDITRVGSPNELMIDDRIAEQSDVDRLIGLSKVRFLQTVMFGQAAPLFLDLSTTDRAALLDDVFNISFWLERSETAAKAEADVQRELVELDKQFATIEGSLNTYDENLVTSLQQKCAEWTEAKQRRIDSSLDEAEKYEIQINELTKQVQALIAETPKLTEQHDTRNLIQHISDLTANIRIEQNEIGREGKLIAFYQRNTICPTCNQTLDAQTAADHKAELIRSIEARTQIVQQITTQIQIVQTELDKLTAENETVQQKNRKFYERQAEIRAEQRALERAIDGIECRLQAEQQTENPFASQLRSIDEQKAKLTNQKARLLVKRADRHTRTEILRYWKQAFKRVRLYLIKQVLDNLQIEIAAAASSLGLHNWQIALTTETETKSGSIKSGIQIVVTPPNTTGSWRRYSGGEQQRIKLAVSIGLANMIQRMASVNIAFEIWDEPTAGLSDEGIGDLLEALTYRAQSADKSIYLLDHRSLNQTAFDQTIFVEKSKDGSRIKEVP